MHKANHFIDVEVGGVPDTKYSFINIYLHMYFNLYVLDIFPAMLTIKTGNDNTEKSAKSCDSGRF